MKGMVFLMEVNRGDVFYIYRTNNYGVEHSAGRPAVIVSTDRHNHTSQLVEVVYLTTQRHDRDFPENVPCSATNADAIILCNQISTVDKDRLSSYITTLTPSEMKAVELGLLHSLGLEKYIPDYPEDDIDVEYKEPDTSEKADTSENVDTEVEYDEPETSEADADYEQLLKELESLRTTKTILATERSVYKSLYENLLKKIIK